MLYGSRGSQPSWLQLIDGGLGVEEERNVDMYSRIVSIGIIACAIAAAACQRAQKYQGVEVRVVDVQQVKQLKPQGGGITSVTTGSDNKFVNVRIEIVWSGNQQELTLAQSDLELIDVDGKKYQADVFPTDPSSGGKKTTTEEIAFIVPDNVQPKSFCMGKICFKL